MRFSNLVLLAVSAAAVPAPMSLMAEADIAIADIAKRCVGCNPEEAARMAADATYKIFKRCQGTALCSTKEAADAMYKIYRERAI